MMMISGTIVNKPLKSLLLYTSLMVLCSLNTLYANDDLEPLKFTGYEFNSNNPFHFNQYRGKLIYLDFWASWCTPCIESIPFMEKLYQQNSKQGFEIIAINIDEHKSDAEQFLTKYPISFKNLYDPTGLIGNAFKVKSMPTAFLIDQSGRIIYKHAGFNQKYSIKLEQTIKSNLEK